MVEESLLLFEFSPCQLSVQQLMNNTNSLFCCLALGMFLNHSKLGIFLLGVCSLKIYGPLSGYVLTHSVQTLLLLWILISKRFMVFANLLFVSHPLSLFLLLAFTSQLNENKKSQNRPQKNLDTVKEELGNYYLKV